MVGAPYYSAHTVGSNSRWRFMHACSTYYYYYSLINHCASWQRLPHCYIFNVHWDYLTLPNVGANLLKKFKVNGIFVMTLEVFDEKHDYKPRKLPPSQSVGDYRQTPALGPAEFKQSFNGQSPIENYIKYLPLYPHPPPHSYTVITFPSCTTIPSANCASQRLGADSLTLHYFMTMDAWSTLFSWSVVGHTVFRRIYAVGRVCWLRMLLCTHDHTLPMTHQWHHYPSYGDGCLTSPPQLQQRVRAPDDSPTPSPSNDEGSVTVFKQGWRD
ncbi:uncharacterized protein LACBIDRAFT_327682 [Laccaria bicolor S238N-H82]|uniref:Predicted protein n=1 Tax=Laccaria bicolor (strain S238N-H82 / ATCC MYA-4686) TaxID=486041 RepID=B0DCI1_LACBS|nr:uncharacterized protein LACBIDRAFT_327682 [Laccaria bicolor S238N-H82]EDR07902.1 predicted protein [Laccaria bicolor S238N-H82]|eukprot:XP_001881691.1 predicted protein [Laccaria bicolor S238N-H82]